MRNGGNPIYWSHEAMNSGIIAGAAGAGQLFEVGNQIAPACTLPAASQRARCLAFQSDTVASYVGIRNSRGRTWLNLLTRFIQPPRQITFQPPFCHFHARMTGHDLPLSISGDFNDIATTFFVMHQSIGRIRYGAYVFGDFVSFDLDSIGHGRLHKSPRHGGLA
jgi:hypothetical protein